jgi:hypothetical protein
MAAPTPDPAGDAAFFLARSDWTAAAAKPLLAGGGRILGRRLRGTQREVMKEGPKQ